MGALPVCLPLFIAGFVRQRDASDPTVDAVSAVSPGTSPVVAVGMNAFAMASLVLGLTGGSIIAVVFGHIARSQIPPNEGDRRRPCHSGARPRLRRCRRGRRRSHGHLVRRDPLLEGGRLTLAARRPATFRGFFVRSSPSPRSPIHRALQLQGPQVIASVHKPPMGWEAAHGLGSRARWGRSRHPPRPQSP